MAVTADWGPRPSLLGQLRAWHLLSLAMVGWMLLIVFAHSSERLTLARAAILLVLPIVAFGALARPAWVVVFIAAGPIGVIEPGRMRPLVLLLAVTLVGQFLQRGSLSLGSASGFIGFTILVAAAFSFRVDLSGDTASFAGGFLNGLLLLLLLGWVSYNITRTGDLGGRQLADALLFGLALTIVLDIALSSDVAGLSGPGTRSLGRKSGYLAAMGFSISFARLLIVPEVGRAYSRAGHLALTLLFAAGMSFGLLRGAWLSAMIAVLFIAVWAGKRKYWLLIPAVLILLLAVPVARERVVPNENIAVTGEASLVSYTTGRWTLWTRLWDEIQAGLPLGHGFGYTFTLSSEDLFGRGSSSFARDPSSTFVYPHNDFLFWMIDLGLLGLFGMVLLWAQIVRAFRAVSRSRSAYARHVQILSGVLVTTFVAQIVANILTSLAFAARFFIVAGFVFGARQWIRREHATSATASLAAPEL